jgi:tRNA-specific 2-thiouridylase
MISDSNNTIDKTSTSQITSIERPEDKKVIVGMSGGVDSSVSAHLLIEQGYQVEGLFMKNWEEDDTDEYCAAAEDLRDAQQVCDKLGIKLHTINFATEYWDNVFEYFLAEYKAGRTPNPDIMCNKEIKFKAFLEFACEDLGADYIATGHYVQREMRDGQWTMIRGLDANKDQSYFLYTLSHEQVGRTLFPVGHIEKPEVRAIAEQADLVTHNKKDSTGICFIGERKFKDFLGQYLPAQPGVIETAEGKVVGKHEGLMYHTLGQRKGLHIGGLSDAGEEPWYVVEKNMLRNVLIVGQGKNHPRLFSKGLIANQLHLVNRKIITEPLTCTVKTRYRQEDVACTLSLINEDLGEYQVMFDQEQSSVTPGQSVVFYQDDVCLGGGIINTLIR